MIQQCQRGAHPVTWPSYTGTKPGEFWRLLSDNDLMPVIIDNQKALRKSMEKIAKSFARYSWRGN